MTIRTNETITSPIGEQLFFVEMFDLEKDVGLSFYNLLMLVKKQNLVLDKKTRLEVNYTLKYYGVDLIPL